MRRFHVLFSFVLLLLVVTTASGAPKDRDRVPLENWTVPGQEQMGRQPEWQDDPFGKQIANATLPSADSSFVAIVPCRVADTRSALGPFGGPFMAAGSVRTFAIPSGPCPGIPATATAYSLNITVVGTQGGGWVTAWPTGAAQPFISTLNYGPGVTLANAAIVPAGTSGSINVYTVADTNLILDINGYFPEQKGQLVTQLQGNMGGVTNAQGAYFPILNYVPPVNARAFSWVRCAFDGNAVGQSFGMRAAIRTPTGTGALSTGNSIYIPSTVAAVNASVQNVNFDFFDLTAGVSYDFGVNLVTGVSGGVFPTGGTTTDYCTATVMIMRR